VTDSGNQKSEAHKFLSGLPENLRKAAKGGLDLLIGLSVDQWESLFSQLVGNVNLPPGTYGSPVTYALRTHSIAESSASDVGVAIMILGTVARFESDHEQAANAISQEGLTDGDPSSFVSWFYAWQPGSKEQLHRWIGAANLTQQLPDLVYDIDLSPRYFQVNVRDSDTFSVPAVSVFIETYQSDRKFMFSMTEPQVSALIEELEEIRDQMRQIGFIGDWGQGS